MTMVTSWDQVRAAVSDARLTFDSRSDEEFCERLNLSFDIQVVGAGALGSAGRTVLADEIGQLAKRIAESRGRQDRTRCTRWAALWHVAEPLLEHFSVIALCRLLRASVLCRGLPGDSWHVIVSAIQRRLPEAGRQGRLVGVSLAKAAGIALRDRDEDALEFVCTESARLGFPFPLLACTGSMDLQPIECFEIGLQYSISAKGTPFLARLWEQFIARTTRETSSVRLYDSFVKHAIHVQDRDLLNKIVEHCAEHSALDDVEIFLALISGVTALGDKDSTRQLWTQMKTSGNLATHPDVCSAMAISAMNPGDAQLYQEIWSHITSRVQVEGHHLASIASACARAKAEELFQSVWTVLAGADRGASLTMRSYEDLLAAALELPDHKSAQRVWDHLQTHALPADVNAAMFQSVISAAMQHRAGDLLSSMVSYAERHLDPTHWTGHLCCQVAEAAVGTKDQETLRRIWQIAGRLPASEMQAQTFGRMVIAAGSLKDARMVNEVWEEYLKSIPRLTIQAKTIGAFLRAGGESRASDVIRSAWQKCVEQVPPADYSSILFRTALPAIATLNDRDLVEAVWARCIETLPTRSYDNPLYGNAFAAASGVGDDSLLSRIWNKGRTSPPSNGWHPKTYISAVYACGRFPERTELLAEVWAACNEDLPDEQWNGDLCFAWAIVISASHSAVLLQRFWQKCSAPGFLRSIDASRVYGVLAKCSAACSAPDVLKQVWEAAASCITPEDVLSWSSFASASAQLEVKEVFLSVWERWTAAGEHATTHDALPLVAFLRGARLLRSGDCVREILYWLMGMISPAHVPPEVYASVLRVAGSLGREDLQLQVHEAVVARLDQIAEHQGHRTPIKRLLGVFAIEEIQAFRHAAELAAYLDREWDAITREPGMRAADLPSIRSGTGLSSAAKRALLDHDEMRRFLDDIQKRSDANPPAVLRDLNTMVALQCLISPDTPEDPYLLEKLAFVNRRLGNFEQAREISDHVSLIDPTPRTRAVSAMNDAWTLLSTGEYLKAAAVFASAASLGGNYQGALLMAAVCCRLSGDFKSAREHLQALRAGPDQEPWRTAVEWARVVWAESRSSNHDLMRAEIDSACIELRRLLTPSYPARGAGATAIFAALASMWPHPAAIDACSIVLASTPHVALLVAFQRAVEIRLIEAEAHASQECLPSQLFGVVLKRYCDRRTPDKVRLALSGLLMLTLAQTYYGGSGITGPFEDLSRATLQTILAAPPPLRGKLLAILFETEPQAVMLELLRRYGDAALTALGPLLGDAKTASRNLTNRDVVRRIRECLAELYPTDLLPLNYGGGDSVDFLDFVTDITDDVAKDQTAIYEGSRIHQPTRSAERCRVRETVCHRQAPLLRRLMDLESVSSPFHEFAQQAGGWSIWTRVEGNAVVLEYHFPEPDCKDPNELARSTLSRVRELLGAPNPDVTAGLDASAWERDHRLSLSIRVPSPAEPDRSLLPVLKFARDTTLARLEGREVVGCQGGRVLRSATQSAVRRLSVDDWFSGLVYFFDTKFAVTFHWVFLSRSSRSPRTAAHTLKNRLEIAAAAHKSEELASIRREALHFASEILRPIHAERTGAIGWTDLRPLVVGLGDAVHASVHLEASCPPGIFVRMQRPFVASILINLLHNCLRALARQGLEQRVVVEVRHDNAKGRAQIRFVNSYDPAYSFPDSTGIGHREIRSLCELSGGSFEVHEIPPVDPADTAKYEVLVTLPSAAPGLIAIGRK